MLNVGQIKKANFYAKQGKELKPTSEPITVFTDKEVEKFKEEWFRKFSNGKPVYQQAAAYILMLNTGIRTAEALGLLISDIDLESRVIHL